MYTLDTQRLRLRPLALDDLDALHRIWTEARVRYYLWDDEIISVATARAAIYESIESFEQAQFGVWGMIDKQMGALIGFCGVRLHAETLDKELLYGVSQPFWGAGLTTEAAQAVIAYLFDPQLTDRLIALANPANVGSCRVAEKLGMRRVRCVEMNGETMCYYAIETEGGHINNV